MFEVTNEILVLCTYRSNYSIYKLKLDAASKQKYVGLFNEGTSNLLLDAENDERTMVPFTSNYTLSEDEGFIISNFELFNTSQEIGRAHV